MRGSSSAPTTRVIDVVEFLSNPGRRQQRFSDIVRELELTQATAHAILKTLTDRGWVSRDSVTKAFELGPALSLIAARVDAARAGLSVAREAVCRLVEATDMSASVVELAGSDLVLTAFERCEDSPIVPPMDERIPYAPPFGVAYAAWDTEDAQREWVQRAAADDTALARRLHDVLDETRKRGYDIDRMTPTIAQAAQLLGELSDVPRNVRGVIDRLRVEFAAVREMAAESGHSTWPVVTISAPVLDDTGHTRFLVAVHPLRPMSPSAIRTVGRHLLHETTRLSPA